MLHTATNSGLHEFVGKRILPRYARAGVRTADLGAGPDEHGDPTHISPFFFDLLQRQYLPGAGVRFREHLVFPPKGFQLTRKPLAWGLRLASLAFSSRSILGDNRVLVIEARP
jgi:hypothetical protein